MPDLCTRTYRIFTAPIYFVVWHASLLSPLPVAILSEKVAAIRDSPPTSVVRPWDKEFRLVWSSAVEPWIWQWSRSEQLSTLVIKESIEVTHDGGCYSCTEEELTGGRCEGHVSYLNRHTLCILCGRMNRRPKLHNLVVWLGQWGRAYEQLTLVPPSSNDNITAYMHTYILGKQSRVSEKSVKFNSTVLSERAYKLWMFQILDS